MKLVVGLGNPGQKYQGTRHNVGFVLVELLAKRFFASPASIKHEAEVTEVQIGQERVLLAAPQTFMNLSGQSVQKIVSYFKISHNEILIACDDIHLDIEKIRIKPAGSAGGQNGLKDIINRLGSQEIPRLRIGVGKPPERFSTSDFVLSHFRKEEKEPIEFSIIQAADAVELWAKEGLDAAMNRYNGSIQ